MSETVDELGKDPSAIVHKSLVRCYTNQQCYNDCGNYEEGCWPEKLHPGLVEDCELCKNLVKREHKISTSELAQAMLDWEQKKRQLDFLEEKIAKAVLELGKTQTVGSVRATFSKGRKSYDYERAAQFAPAAVLHKHSFNKVDYRAVCKELDLEVPYEQADPSVKLKLI